MLLGVALLTLALFLTSRDAANFQFTSARYLIPLYLATPLFFGVLWEAAQPVFVRLRAIVRNPSPQPPPLRGEGCSPVIARLAFRVTWKHCHPSPFWPR